MAYPGAPLLNEVGQFSVFGAIPGVLIAAVHLAGIVLRSKRKFLRMGIDSIIVLFVSAAGLVLLFRRAGRDPESGDAGPREGAQVR